MKTPAPIRLVDVAKYYKGQPHQDKALNWFDQSTGKAKQETFARIYRNKGTNSDRGGEVEQEPDISFVDAFRWFEGTAWQVNAFNWLQSNSHVGTIEEFARLWRAAPPPAISKQRDYWVQITHNLTRMPQSAGEKRNLERACDMLLKIETHLGVPLTLTSGFRPEPINSQVGGVPGSFHVQGLAADFYSAEMDDFKLEDAVFKFWYQGGKGGVGKGMQARGFCHVDLGSPRSWWY